MSRDKIVTSKIMSSIKSKDTKPEKLLGSAMWRNGLRYRKHYNIKGKPDFVFLKRKIAVFCDGDFWHGNNWKIRGYGSLEKELKRYSKFWKQKITSNIERDKKVNQELRRSGWKVLRYWESDIRKNPDKIAIKIVKIISNLN